MNLQKQWNRLNKPIIGVTGPSRFSGCIQGMIEGYLGARPLYFIWNKRDDLRYFLEQVDGVIFAGGTDIGPNLYGKKIDEKDKYKYAFERDARELFMMNWCIKHKIPQLAICRGMQLASVREGLDFDDEIKYAPVDHQPRKVWRGQFYEEENVEHPIDILSEYQNEFPFNEKLPSFHHQGVVFT